MKKLLFLVVIGFLSYEALSQQTHTASVTIVSNCDVLGVEDDSQTLLTIYPNPITAANEIQLSIEAAFAGDLTVIDQHGRIVFRKRLQMGSPRISLVNLSSGLYTIHLKNGTQYSSNRIIIE